MRKIIVLSFISLDGVMQAPGGPEEDTSGGFKYGGWTFPYFDEVAGKIMGEQMKQPSDLLLGRKTFDIFSNYWPQHEEGWPGINEATKYVVSNTLTKADWKNSIIIKDDIVEEIKKLKAQDGPDLKVWGSANLIQTLLKHDLVDELLLKTFPVTLGSGKRLFADLPAPRPNLFFVYAILCDDGSIYIGQTQDLSERWNQHAAGYGAEHTKLRKPIEIIHYEEYITRELAVKREHDLKTGFGRKWLKREWKAGRTRQAGGTIPVAFKLTDSKVTPSGVIVANYERAGEVKTGSFV